MKAELNYIIGSRTKRAREAAGLTQEKLAELIDRSKEAVSNIERGVNLPTLDTLARISDVTGVSLSHMVESEQVDIKKRDLLDQIIPIMSKMSDRDLRLSLSILMAIAEQYRHTD